MIDITIAATKTTLAATLGFRSDRLTPTPRKLTSANFPLSPPSSGLLVRVSPGVTTARRIRTLTDLMALVE
jgi:hypothetical protein